MATATQDGPDLTEAMNKLKKLSGENLEERFVSEIDERLALLSPVLGPLQQEHERLTAIRQRLQGTMSGRARASASRSTGTSRGSRREQFITAVTTMPGRTVGEIAKEIGVEASYLYRVKNKAEVAGEVRVEDGKLFPVAV